MKDDRKYQTSTCRELTKQQWRQVGVLIGTLVVALVVVVVVAVLVAFGELSLR